ncbi:MAG: hypothetical protein K0R09_1212 [Clostridiales bacterium]|nr:hypothetical protein [Clostridiales bacterium]
MKEKKRISTFTIIIIVLSVIVSIELIIILKNVFSIKSENGKLKYEIYKVTQENKRLDEKNKGLEKIIKDFQEPNLTTSEVPEGWRVFRQLSFGFEVGLPQNWRVEKGEEVLSIISENSSVKVDFITEDIKDYWNIDNYVNKKYKYSIYVKEGIVVNNQKYDIYKQSGTKRYYIFIKGKNYIFDISSTSEEYLKKIIGTFKFI